jgi:ubiquinone/menaquinone biosynthesis C-methylase UbiE
MADQRTFFIDGAAYDRMMGRWSALAGAEFLDWLAPSEGLRWLDVGCGTGAFTELLIGRCAPVEVQGIDPAAAQIAYASKRPGARLAQFRQGDAQALPFADDSFDVAIMALVIAFVPDTAKAIAEMIRVVRPGGWLAAYMWDFYGDGSPTGPLTAALRSINIAYAMPPSIAFSQRDNMVALWRQARLAAIETRSIQVPVSYADFDEFWAVNSVVGPAGIAVRGLSPSTRDKLKTRLREQLPRDRDGRISYLAHANAVKGQIPG